MSTMEFKRNISWLSQQVVKTDGEISTHQSHLARGNATSPGQAADETLHHLHTTPNVDVAKSLAIERTRNQERMQEIRNYVKSGDMDEPDVKYWIEALQAYEKELALPYVELGALHIVCNKTAGHSATFVVMFSAQNRGGAMKPKTLPDAKALTKYLQEGVGLQEHVITQTLVEAEANGASDIQVQLRRDRQRILGLR